MNAILIVLLLWCLIGLIAFFWGIYKAPIIEDIEDAPVRDEDWLLKNEPNYLGQGHWIK